MKDNHDKDKNFISLVEKQQKVIVPIKGLVYSKNEIKQSFINCNKTTLDIKTKVDDFKPSANIKRRLANNSPEIFSKNEETLEENKRLVYQCKENEKKIIIQEREIISLNTKISNLMKENLLLKNKLNNRNPESSIKSNKLFTSNKSEETFQNDVSPRIDDLLENKNRNIKALSTNDIFQTKKPNFSCINNTVDVDMMSYEQLLDLQDKIGYVKVGYSKNELDSIETIQYSKKNSKQENCRVCLNEFNEKDLLRRLCCSHDFHKNCIDEWLYKTKNCPICKNRVEINK